MDLEYSLSLGHIVHDSKIDWLELNELASKLLFRDRRMRLMLVDVDTMLKYTILQFCKFVHVHSSAPCQELDSLEMNLNYIFASDLWGVLPSDVFVAQTKR